MQEGASSTVSGVGCPGCLARAASPGYLTPDTRIRSRDALARTRDDGPALSHARGWLRLFASRAVRPGAAADRLRDRSISTGLLPTISAGSNLGYGIIAYITSHVAGRPYADFMRTEVFEPLGLTRTSVQIEAQPKVTAAVSYTEEGERLPYYVFDEWGSGRVFSTAHDLALFGSFHLKRRSLVSDRSSVLPRSTGCAPRVRPRVAPAASMDPSGFTVWDGEGASVPSTTRSGSDTTARCRVVGGVAPRSGARDRRSRCCKHAHAHGPRSHRSGTGRDAAAVR